MEQNEIEKGYEQAGEVEEVEAIAKVIKKEEKNGWMLPASIVFAAILISAAFIYASGSKNTIPKPDEEAGVKLLELVESDAVLGDANAPVTIIEYGDFQCPGCVAFAMTGEALIRKDLVETGKAKFVFRPYPIVDQIVGKGTESQDSALALLCAREQGKFWEMHDGLYAAEAKDEETFQASGATSPEGNGNLNRALFIKTAKSIGMNESTFVSCYDTDAQQGALDAIIEQAKEFGVQGTPTIFVNGKELDMRPYRSWQEVVEYIKTLAQ